MNNLAPELLHITCRNLETWYVSKFRFINRDCAAVGLEYLLSTVGIHLHRNSWIAHSFVRLQAIGSYPVMSKNIRELYYDFKIMDLPMKDFATWKADAEE
jgi:hypothetical protein